MFQRIRVRFTETPRPEQEEILKMIWAVQDGAVVGTARYEITERNAGISEIVIRFKSPKNKVKAIVSGAYCYAKGKEWGNPLVDFDKEVAE